MVSELKTSIGADGNGFADGGQMTPTNCDVLIIGAGMAGVSAAAHLAPHMRVIVAEREAQPAYHATGRSAAMFTETYGNNVARALTRASRDFLHHPPAGFSDSPLLARRGVMMVATPNLADALRAQFDRFRPLCSDLQWLDADAARRRVPVLRPGFAAAAFLEPGAR